MISLLSFRNNLHNSIFTCTCYNVLICILYSYYSCNISTMNHLACIIVNGPAFQLFVKLLWRLWQTYLGFLVCKMSRPYKRNPTKQSITPRHAFLGVMASSAMVMSEWEQFEQMRQHSPSVSLFLKVSTIVSVVV